ncbi:hypothetical protein GGS23DRAFT_562428 [Durotheca rogersii]|uniref:uncharacterized protein n=1 Tax=Durotheca rogersii TaxID=419775 RepID=UPI00222076DF|nr:uncharacterized protein GGS23DRAFT_562428 [Durotheca rogersii]KAI5864941.1 hypothetical protein GGS23DRAFT_562428 [Durotheca rogersii]
MLQPLCLCTCVDSSLLCLLTVAVSGSGTIGEGRLLPPYQLKSGVHGRASRADAIDDHPNACIWEGGSSHWRRTVDLFACETSIGPTQSYAQSLWSIVDSAHWYGSSRVNCQLSQTP